MEKFNPCFIRFKHKDIRCLSLFFYDENYKSLLYQYKGCGDIELKAAFVSYFAPLLRIYFKGYYLVNAPSSFERISSRGFDHVKLMFESLNRPFIDCLQKNKDHKQSERNSKERKKVKFTTAECG